MLGAHRGHRLSTLAKVANLRHLAENSPQTRRLHTSVGVDDEVMWAVNQRFGFRPET
ncbi:hypothetical protein GCM10009839_60850 [Catenulispora yoronensis]|uniref:Uncharacterized protein n=1 Tax=Catenulispora yoronensis TaxID=450799 RepID=A0ABP5GIU5_9ACTN